MTSSGRSTASSQELLRAFLADLPASPPRRFRFPLAGTLPQLSARLEAGTCADDVVSSLRCLGQVIFINNPVSGLLLLLALALQSAWTGLLALVGIVGAHATARWLPVSAHARRNGIHGFNAVLVGCAAAAFADLGSAGAVAAWILMVGLAAALSTALLHICGEWLFQRAALPPLTLPFCLATWLMLTAAGSLELSPLTLAGEIPPLFPSHPPDDAVGVLLRSVPTGFGQVFLCSRPLSGWLVLAAVAVASPLAAAVGLAGGLAGALTALVTGEDLQAVALGLFSFNAVLTAIALGGIFFPLNRRSLAIALVAACLSSLLLPPLQALLARGSLPVLTAPFILTTLVSMLLIRRAVPSLIPVALHSLLTPEEHRRRYRVSRSLLAGFRRQLAQSIAGSRDCCLLASADGTVRRALQELFSDLDRDGNGRLSVAELAAGLIQRRRQGKADVASRSPFLELQRVLHSMDLDGDGAVNAAEFGELMLRLRQLEQGHEELITYLLPVDADADDRLDPQELERLLRSVGQSPLSAAEQELVHGPAGEPLSWSEFIDRLLLT